jgi:hypothetical protein
MSEQPRTSSKQEIFESTVERVSKYISQEGVVEQILRLYPDYPNQEKEKDKESVLIQVQELENYFELIFPFIKKIRSYILNVTDQNRTTACYFLFGKVSNSFRALFLLAREGLSYEVVEITRGIQEALDLAHLFLYEEENSPNLQKWFSGDIIENSIARTAQAKFINQQSAELGLQIPFPLKEVTGHKYRLFSLYSHTAYSALLDSFDPYNRDFDFERNAGFHYMSVSGLPLVRSILETTLIALKQFYGVVGDKPVYGELNAILLQLAPRLGNIQSDEQGEKQILSLRERFLGR